AGSTTATVTLGDLYLRQGHLLEAERIFREVLSGDPGNAVAAGALSRIASRLYPLDAAQLLTGFPAESAAGAAGHDPERPGAPIHAKKVYLLNGYLERLRRAGRRDVP
ncbi:MAG: hypothetical protein M3O15_01040, partial [Acidobacteriota bacterium]|nr:hypothetical protein [Acidobacteriota bacterium]